MKMGQRHAILNAIALLLSPSSLFSNPGIHYHAGMATFDIKIPGRPLLSFEFFPPKTSAGEARFWESLVALARYQPDFISVTYGAGGGDRENTGRLVCEVQDRLSLTAMPHLTCIGESRINLEALLSHYEQKGITHVMALRGDRSDQMPPDALTQGAFGSADAFVTFIRQRYPHLRIGVACYPECHPEAKDRQADLAYYRRKIQAGGDFAITQFFYDNDAYERFVADNRQAGVCVPVIPGIMPITDFKQIKRFATLCGAQLPGWLVARLEEAREDPVAMQEIGIDVAIQQCRDLLDRGAPGLHFFTLNRAEVVGRVLEALHGAPTWGGS
ncbi:MAG: methylenetetrahydrofolate reductase [NAD(P)H] [Magnetococcales bacterium]|nr:methylenetetrahydrofolate reductase [NAD(P)H] [Magnetococcales bacterium]MBF0321940.1 methylenetetrahydrofolate reductase [NAD(P)H] [Magnetococcales bacterium]